MFWSEPGRDVRVPVDPHTWTLPSDMFWSEPGKDVRVPVDPHFVDLTFRHVLV